MKTQTFSFAGGRLVRGAGRQARLRANARRPVRRVESARSARAGPARDRRVHSFQHRRVLHLQGAGEAALSTRGHAAASPASLSIAISCVGRRLVLGERAEEETEAVLEVVPPDTRQIGFYSYGEISPYASGHCDLHNQTMTLTIIGEA